MVDIYRPPGHISNDFLNEFSLLLEHFTLQKDRILICGDFNVHFENKSNTAVCKFYSLLGAFGLTQHVDAPTHTSGHTLDLVITRSDDQLPFRPEANELFSDHIAVCFKYPLFTPKNASSNVSYRKLKQLDLTDFKEDISCLKDINTSNKSLDTLISEYNTVLRAALDKHAPSITKPIKGSTAKPWYDDEVHQERNTKRKMERSWRKSRTKESLHRYKTQKNHLNRMIDNKKITYCNDSFNDKSGDPKALYTLVRKLTNKPTAVTYPETQSNVELSETFSAFFKDKIKKINDSLESNPNIALPSIEPRLKHSVYSEFPTISIEEVKKYIEKSPSKACALDPVPTTILKQCLDEVSPVVTEIVNRSLSIGYMPNCLKEALITPIPKKANVAELKNFRPISNLPFISKLVERIVVDKLSDYCDKNDLNEKYQSAYRKGHSCETALLHVANTILTNMDTQQVTILTLLDLSAALDTIPHERFLQRLEEEYGIKDTALAWFQSYFKDRVQSVQVNGVTSEKQALDTGMP